MTAPAWLKLCWCCPSGHAALSPFYPGEQPFAAMEGTCFRGELIAHARHGRGCFVVRPLAGNHPLFKVLKNRPNGQKGLASLSAPMNHLESLVVSGKFRHRGAPVTRWMFDHVSVKMGPAGNIKPDKEKCAERIDGRQPLRDWRPFRNWLMLRDGFYRHQFGS